MPSIIPFKDKYTATLAQLMVELWPDANYEEEVTYVREALLREGEIFYLLLIEGIPQGFIQCKLRHDYVEGVEKAPCAYIEGIFIRPDYRRQGWANKLVQAAELWAKRKGIRQMASDAEISNLGSIAFHQSIGFKEMNRVVCFLKDLD